MYQQKSMWQRSVRRSGIWCVAVALSAVTAVNAVEVEPDPAWHANVEVLTKRVERLSEAGAYEAAQVVLKELQERAGAERGYADRARFALARLALQRGEVDQAEALTESITWSDKEAAVAADLLSFQLALHWRGMRDKNDQLRSGMVQPTETSDGSALFYQRQRHAQKLSELLAGGAAMVAAEGHEMVMPADATWLALAEYAYGYQESFAEQPDQSPDIHQALGLLALEDHEVEQAVRIAEALQLADQQAQCESLVYALGVWQGRRTVMIGVVPLWTIPGIDVRVAALLQSFPTAAARAQRVVNSEGDLHRLGSASAAGREMQETIDIPDLIEVEVEQPVGREEAVSSDELNHPLANIALNYESFQVQAAPTVSTSKDAIVLSMTSAQLGWHRVRVWQLADMAALRRMIDQPQRDYLGDQPVIDTTYRVTADQRGGVQRWKLPQTLSEGVYVISVEARGAPVVALTSVVVMDADVTAFSHGGGIGLWAVDRLTGLRLANEPLTVAFSRTISPAKAAGPQWDRNTDVWQTGFQQGYLGNDFVGRSLLSDADSLAGIEAGKRAAARVVTTTEITVQTAADGTASAVPPVDWQAEAYGAEVRLTRHGAQRVVRAAVGVAAPFALKCVAWADRSLARPGESLHFRAILREHNGDVWRMPTAYAPVVITLIESEVRTPLWTGDMPVAADGSLHGECVVPSECVSGTIEITIFDTSRRLCTVQRMMLPQATLQVAGPLDDQVVAGQPFTVMTTVLDRFGQPLADTQVSMHLAYPTTGMSDGRVQQLRTDAQGRAQATFATSAAHQQSYVVVVAAHDEDSGQTGTIAEQRYTCKAQLFPFPVEFNMDEYNVVAGGLARFRVTFPLDARLRCELTREGISLGDRTVILGGGDQATEVALPVPMQARDTLAVTLSCSGPNGATISQSWPIQVLSPQSITSGFDITCDRPRLDPDEALNCIITTEQPGLDVLVLTNAQDLMQHYVVRTTGTATSCPVQISELSAPNMYCRSIGWTSRSGFVLSEVREVKIRPLDRLLRVEAVSDEADWQVGRLAQVAIHVTDWHGHAVANAHMSIGLCDARVYDVAPDYTPDLWDFFHKYSRPDGLAIGTVESMPVLQAYLWRSIIRREGMFGSRSGSGKGYAMGCHGGSRRSGSLAKTAYVSDVDPVILWQGDVSTDANGRVVVPVQLPQRPGSWQLTARVNDASARVMVGSVKQTFTATARLHVALDCPSAGHAGDSIQARVSLHNRDNAERTLHLTINDQVTTATVAPGARVVVPIMVTLPPGTGPLIERDGLIGHLQTLSVLVRDDAGVQEPPVGGSCFIPCPGFPQTYTIQQVVGADGVVHIPQEISGGTALWWSARAWASPAARAEEWLSTARAGNGCAAHQALAWILAEPSPARNLALAALWPKMGSEPVDDVVRMVAFERHFLATPPIVSDVYISAVRQAVCRQPWYVRPQEAGFVTRAAQRVLGSRDASWEFTVAQLYPQTEAWKVVIAADVARRCGDADAAVRRYAVAALPWTDPYIAALAVLNSYELTNKQPSVLLADVDGQAYTLSATEPWLMTVVTSAHFRAAPGTIIFGQLRVQAEYPVSDVPLRKLRYYQLQADVWCPVEPDQLRPQRRTMCTWAEPEATTEATASRATEFPKTISMVLPSVVLPTEYMGDNLMNRDRMVLDRFLFDEIAWTTAERQGRDPRQLLADFSQGWRQSYAIEPMHMPVGWWTGESVSGVFRKLSADEGVHEPMAWTWITADAGQGLVDMMAVTEDGRFLWQAHDTLTIGPDDELTTFISLGDHPEAKALQELSHTVSLDEAKWLLAQFAQSSQVTDHHAALYLLQESVHHRIQDILRHPSLSDNQHWSWKILAAWSAQPLSSPVDDWFDRPINPRELSLIDALAMQRQIQISLDRLSETSAVPMLAMTAPTLRACVQTLVAAYRPDITDLDAWLWMQALPAWSVNQPFQISLDAWCQWMNTQLGLPVRIAADIPLFLDYRGVRLVGSRLGRDQLIEAGYRLVRLPDGYEVQWRDQYVSSTVTVDCELEDAPFEMLLALVNRARQNRGQRTYRCTDADLLQQSLSLAWKRGSAVCVLEYALRICQAKVVERPDGLWIVGTSSP